MTTSRLSRVIGTGFIGPVHIEALKRLGVTVNGICGSTKSARQVGNLWGIPEIYGDYDHEAMYASPNIDVVHITSPNKVHVEQCLAALAAAYPLATLDLQSMVWMQGESDAVSGASALYQANLTAFIADVRSTYGSSLPFVIARLSSGSILIGGNLNVEITGNIARLNPDGSHDSNFLKGTGFNGEVNAITVQELVQNHTRLDIVIEENGTNGVERALQMLPDLILIDMVPNRGAFIASRPSRSRWRSCPTVSWGMSMPVTSSVTGCSTCTRVFISMKKNSPFSYRNSKVPAPR